MSESRGAVRRIGVRALIYTLADVAAKLSMLVTTLALSHVLSSADFGAFALSGSLVAVLAAILGFGLETAAARWYFDAAPGAYPRQVFTLACTQVSLGLLAAVSLEWLVFPFLPNAAPPPAYATLARIAVWTGLALSLTRMPAAILASQEKVGAVCALALISALGPVAGLLGGVALGGPAILPVLLGQLVGTGSVGLVCLAVTLSMSQPVFERDVLFRALRFALPLVPNMVALSLMGLTDRLLLERMAGRTAVGAFHLANLVGMGVILIGLAIHRAWAPSFMTSLVRLDGLAASAERGSGGVRAEAERTWRAARTDARATACLLFSVAVGATLWSEPVLRWLAAAEYSGAMRLIAPVVASAAAHGFYVMQATPLVYRSRTGLISLVTAAAALVNLALNLWWVPRFGAYGAASATLASSLLLCALASGFAIRGGRPALASGEIAGLLALLAIPLPIASLQTLGGGLWLELLARAVASLLALAGMAALGFAHELRVLAAAGLARAPRVRADPLTSGRH